MNKLQKIFIFAGFWGTNELDRINYFIERLINKIFNTNYDFKYRCYIEEKIEDVRTWFCDYEYSLFGDPKISTIGNIINISRNR